MQQYRLRAPVKQEKVSLGPYLTKFASSLKTRAEQPKK